MHKKSKTKFAQKDNVTKKENGLTDFMKKKAGFVVGVIFFVALILLIFAFSFLGTINPEMEGIYARSLHENNLDIIEYHLESINSQISEQYVDPLEDDFVYSIKDDLEWLKQKENEVYTSKPSNEVLMKELAFSYFLGDVLVVNQAFLYDSYEFADKEETINKAINLNFVSKRIVSEDIDYLFEGEEQKRVLFEKTYNELIAGYISWKKVMLNSDTGIERKFVEAEKVIYITTEEEPVLEE